VAKPELDRRGAAAHQVCGHQDIERLEYNGLGQLRAGRREIGRERVARDSCSLERPTLALGESADFVLDRVRYRARHPAPRPFLASRNESAPGCAGELLEVERVSATLSVERGAKALSQRGVEQLGRLRLGER
jgi:hypothetical protein